MHTYTHINQYASQQNFGHNFTSLYNEFIQISSTPAQFFLNCHVRVAIFFALLPKQTLYTVRLTRRSYDRSDRYMRHFLKNISKSARREVCRRRVTDVYISNKSSCLRISWD